MLVVSTRQRTPPKFRAARPCSRGPERRPHVDSAAFVLDPQREEPPTIGEMVVLVVVSLSNGDSALICGAIRPKERAGDRAQQPVGRWKQDGSSAWAVIFQTLFAALPDFEIFKRVFSLAEIIRPQR